MDDLILALTILKKYIVDSYNLKFPTSCEHDVLYVSVDPESVSDDDKIKLEDLGFIAQEEDACFVSYRFGSF